MRKQKKAGFSLVELMVVVAIIGVLASIAIPRYRIFQAKARQSEAKVMLRTIYTLEQAYFAEHDTYIVINAVCTGEKPNMKIIEANSLAIGFTPACENFRYTYTVAACPAGIITSCFLATATSGVGALNKVVPGCTEADEVTMDNIGTLKAENPIKADC